MPPLLEQIAWMPSPPLVPDQTSIDTVHLRRMTLGESALERDVLSLFAQQSRDLLERLAAMPADAAVLVHTLKGSARAIGAFAVADAAQALETAMRAKSGIAEALRELAAAADDAQAAIDTLLNKS